MILGLLSASCGNGQEKKNNSETGIWFNQPAQNWNEAIPIGNGSLGGMVYGGIKSDTIKINEETLWSGGPRDLQNHEAIKYLPKIRQLLLDGKTKKAGKLINKTMIGEYNESYMPMGDLVINTKPKGKVENYNAEINYRGVEIANLSECHLPLIELTKQLSVDGAKTARNMYGAGGWIAHHNADIWRTTSPVGGNGLWAIYQVGSAWLCHHLWEHY